METAVTRDSSVDRIAGFNGVIADSGHLFFIAHQGSEILDHAERYLRDEYGPKDWQAIHKLADARTDLRAVMEYLDGIAEVSK